MNAYEVNAYEISTCVRLYVAKFLSGNSLPSCSQTRLYSQLSHIDFMCVGCTQSHWLFLENGCVIFFKSEMCVKGSLVSEACFWSLLEKKWKILTRTRIKKKKSNFLTCQKKKVKTSFRGRQYQVAFYKSVTSFCLN